MSIAPNRFLQQLAPLKSRSLAFGRKLSLAALAISLAGCGAARPIKYYQLTVPTEVAPAAPATGSTIALVIGPIITSHLYREDRIVYSTNATELGDYEYHRWSEPPTEMLHDIVMRDLRASGKYREIFSERSNAKGDYLLRGHLYDFKEVDGGGIAARITMEWELRDLKTGATVWTHLYKSDEPVTEKNVSTVVAALDRNTQRCASDLKSGLDQFFASVPAK